MTFHDVTGMLYCIILYCIITKHIVYKHILPMILYYIVSDDIVPYYIITMLYYIIFILYRILYLLNIYYVI